MAELGQLERRAVRALDMVLSAVLLVLLALPMLALALLVKLTSRGPAFYSQARAGLHGRPFVIYKLRTMRDDAESATGPVWAKNGDPRCTPIGHYLRRWGLDELPQLLNVLRGDMSLVGPRPERPYFVEQFAASMPSYSKRHQVLPGMTGWAQINGWRGDSSLARRLECDLYYIEHRSLAFYLQILLLTPLRVAMNREGE